jgi:glycosyltransferase involved in cell wall biosynthesis
MKIVYVMGDLTYPNGMSRVISQKVNYLAEHTDYEVHAVLTENAGMPFYFPLSPKVQYVNFDINFEVLNTMPMHKKVLPFLKKQHLYRRMFTDYLMELRPDVTVSILRREINFINDIPDGSRKIGEIHFSRPTYRRFNKSFLPSFVNKAVTRLWQGQMDRQIKRLDKCVILTEEDRANWVGFNNIEVIPNPISRFPEVRSDCSRKVVITAGRYSPEKGYDRLFKVWRIVIDRHPDWQLNMFGIGEREKYQQLAQDMGLGSTVKCNGPVKDIYAKYAESSIFAITSYYEGFGLVIAEAMATGVPPVAFTFQCGPRDIITDGVDGILVEDGNIEKMADAICYLIEHDDIRHEMGRRGIESAQRFHEDRIMQRWLKIFG